MKTKNTQIDLYVDGKKIDKLNPFTLRLVKACCICNKTIKLKNDHIEIRFIDDYCYIACKKHKKFFETYSIFINANTMHREFDTYIVERRKRNFNRLLKSMRKKNQICE